MRWAKLVGVGLCIWLVPSSPTAAALNGFVESFSGEGPYDGLENPDWFIVGNNEFEDGAARFVNFDSANEFGRKLSGRGSFKLSIEFRELFLGDLEILSTDAASGNVDLLYNFTPGDDSADSISISMNENTGTPPGEWTFVVGSSVKSGVVGTSVPQGRRMPDGELTPVRLELIYDDLERQYSVTYDHDIEDAVAALEFGPFPFDPNINELEQHLILTTFASTVYVEQTGLLDYFAVEPFSNVPGDFDGDGILDAGDIDELSAQLRAGTTDGLYDLNADALVNDLDRQTWVHDLKQTYFGDADFTGTFDSTDLVQVLAFGEYEDNVQLNSTWLTGDWDGDGEFTSSDLVVALADGGYEAGSRAAAVPEPTTVWLALLPIALAIYGRKTHSCETGSALISADERSRFS